jgi:uncharacterized protein YbjQ (UPF0145 family)
MLLTTINTIENKKIVDYETVGQNGSMLMIIASGTAVVYE